MRQKEQPDFNQHAVDEILSNLQSRDLLKARLVLDHFDSIDEYKQRLIVEALDGAECEVALPLLVHLFCQSNKAIERFPFIEKSIAAKAPKCPDIVCRHAQTSSPTQLFFINLAGKLALPETDSTLQRVLLTATDQEILRATMDSLGKIGVASAVTSIAEFLICGDEVLINSAIIALGNIASPAALDHLADHLDKNEQGATLIIDIFSSIQSENAFLKLNSCLRSRFASVRSYAKMKIKISGNRFLPLLATNLFCNDSELQIHTLNLLQEIGDQKADPFIRQLINMQPSDANVRFAAYEAIADISSRTVDLLLANGLFDPDDNVRMAVARAIDNHLSEKLAAAIRPHINKANSEAEKIVLAVIDALAAKLFVALLDSPFFQSTAKNYLLHKCHPDTSNFFITVLSDHGHNELAATLKGELKNAAAQKDLKRVCAVDDSRMILNVYRTSLSQLGYEPILFQKAAEALEWMATEQPDLLCTDLHMPEIDGIELSKLVRQRYGKDALPIVMVTTRNEEKTRKEAYEAGVDVFLAKPFNAASLEGCLNFFLAT